MTDKRTAADSNVSSTVNDEHDGETVGGEGEEDLDYETLLQQLHEARTKADENWNQTLRTRADMDNLRRRSERDVENAHKYALEKIAGDLLPVKDSLELGLSAAQGESQNVAKLIEGTDLTLKMLRTVMEKSGIREINPLHEKFNPEQHQAMSMQQSAEHEANTVVAVYQKGYLLNDRLLRPALVVVSAGPGGGKSGPQGEANSWQSESNNGGFNTGSVDELA